MSTAKSNWRTDPSYVYFIGAGELHVAIKIGVSAQKSMRDRLGTIQGGNHEPLYLLGVIPFNEGERAGLDAYDKEKELHGRFSKLQRFKPTYAGSEWFTVSPELTEFIERETTKPQTLGLEVTAATPGPGRSKKS